MTDTGLVKRYLLGSLSDDERTRFEDEYFSDAERFGELEVEEDELIDSYVRGGLSNSERKQFKQQYLTSPARRSGVDFAFTLKEFTRQNEGLSLKKSVSRWWSPWALFNRPYGWPRMALVAAGLAFVVVCGSWLPHRESKTAN